MPLVWILLPTALGADIHIDPSGAPATLQAAVDQATSGDTIHVPAGTLVGCANLGGRDLAIVGAGAAETTLDGGGCAELVRARSAEQLTLEGLRLTNPGGRCVAVLGGVLIARDSVIDGCGAPDISGGGVWARASDTTLERVEVLENQGYEGAGLLSWDGGRLTVQHSVFSANIAAEQGGAIYGNGRVEGTITDTVFEDNAAPERVAGAVAWHLGTLSIARSAFRGNEALLYGGALYPHHVSEGVLLEDVVFEDNAATAGDGGAVATAFGTVLQTRGVVFDGNRARDGAAIWATGGSLTLDDTRLQENQATARGGALLLTGDAALAGTALGFCDNAALEGGALYLDGGRHRLERAWFARSTAPDGGGAIAASGGDLSLAWVTIVGSDTGGAAVDVAGGSIDLHSSLLAWTAGGGGLRIRDGASTTGGTNAWWANEGGDTLDEAPAPTAEDVLADPALLAWEDGAACAALDLRLQRGSPLVDAGRADAADPDGSRADIGAWGGPGADWTDEDGDGDAYPVDCDDTDPVIGPDCTERGDTGPADTGPADTGPGPDTTPGGGTGVKTSEDGGCGGGGAAATLLPLVLLGLRRREPEAAEDDRPGPGR
jgi:predicted outer membrane repeat protein